MLNFYYIEKVIGFQVVWKKTDVELSPIIDNSTFVFRLNQLFHIEKALLLCYNI